jgi:hypothetical protein
MGSVMLLWAGHVTRVELATEPWKNASFQNLERDGIMSMGCGWNWLSMMPSRGLWCYLCWAVGFCPQVADRLTFYFVRSLHSDVFRSFGWLNPRTGTKAFLRHYDQFSLHWSYYTRSRGQWLCVHIPNIKCCTVLQEMQWACYAVWSCLSISWSVCSLVRFCFISLFV